MSTTSFILSQRCRQLMKATSYTNKQVFSKNYALVTSAPLVHCNFNNKSDRQNDSNDRNQKRYFSSSNHNNDTEALLSSFANLDHGREKRTGFPEAIFAQGKTPYQIAKILDDMAGHVNNNNNNQDTSTNNKDTTDSDKYSNAILATRVDPDLYKEVSNIPLENGYITYHETARIISMKAKNSNDNIELESLGRVVVASAGTTDLFVAEEAAVTLEATGKVEVDRVYDAGVAGLHRILNALPKLRHPDVKCILVCAGMDGALPSVVAGLVSVPVVAIPTSVGYGASFQGVSALLTMLNTCSPGVGVVNIDNGFGGAALAYKFLHNANK